MNSAFLVGNGLCSLAVILAIDSIQYNLLNNQTAAMRAVDPYSIVSDPDPDADKELDPTLQKLRYGF